MENKLPGPETFWSYLINIFTLGGLYFTKIAAKKALYEVNADIIAQRSPSGPDQPT